MQINPRFFVRLPSTWPLFVALALTLSACHGDQHRALTALDVASRALITVDNIAAPRYAEAAAAAYDAATSRADYEARMRPWNRIEESEHVARAALITAEIGIQAGQPHADVLGCAGLALSQVLAALDAVHIDLPAPVRAAIEALAAARGAACMGVTP